jgi:hypothetical protein
MVSIIAVRLDRMWRVVMVVALVGCAEEPAPMPWSTDPYVPQICMSGTPGTPTCPLNQVHLGGAFSSELDFVFSPFNSEVRVQNISVTTDAERIDDLALEIWPPEGSGGLFVQPQARVTIVGVVRTGTWELSPLTIDIGRSFDGQIAITYASIR